MLNSERIENLVNEIPALIKRDSGVGVGVTKDAFAARTNEFVERIRSVAKRTGSGVSRATGWVALV